MKSSRMNCKRALAEEKKMDLLQTLEEGNWVAPNIESSTKSEWVQSNEHVLKERHGILGFFLKILLPKSITTTPPPDIRVYY